MASINLCIGTLVILHLVPVSRGSTTSVSVSSLNLRNSLDNPCDMDLGGTPLSVAYSLEAATYLPTLFLDEIERANMTINNMQDTTRELSFCLPIMNERLTTFPDPPVLQGKSTEEVLHLLHRELIYILAHFHFARHDFDLFRDHCITHFPDTFGNKIDRSIGRFRNVLCNMMTRVGYSSEVQQNLEDVFQVLHSSRMDCSQRRDWTCVLLSSTRQALRHLYDLLQYEEVQSKKKKNSMSWDFVEVRKRVNSDNHLFDVFGHRRPSEYILEDNGWTINKDYRKPAFTPCRCF